MRIDDDNCPENEQIIVWADGKWRMGGLAAYFSQQYEWLRQRIPTLPSYLPPHCLDPIQLARFLGEDINDFDWKGPESSQVLAAIERVEGKLGAGATVVRKSANDVTTQMLTTKEVSILLGCSYSEAREKMLDGRIKSVKEGRWLRSRKEWVEEYLLQQVVKKPEQVPEHIPVKRPKAKVVGQFKKGGLAYEFLMSRPD